MAVKPITPIEAIDRKNVPDGVIESFNELIIEKISQGTAEILQEDIIERIISKGLATKENRKDILTKRWLDVENIYKKEGWTVTYDRPAYDESYEPSFTFRANK